MSVWLHFFLFSLFAFAASIGFGILFQIRGKNLLLTALGGAVGWIIYLFLEELYPSVILQYFLAAAGISLYSEWMAIVRKVPVTVFLIVAFIPLVPGGAIFQTMKNFLFGDYTQFVATGTYTIKVAGAIALGIFGTSSFIRMIRKGKTAIRRQTQQERKPSV